MIHAFAETELHQTPPAESIFDYVVYGLRVRSALKLAGRPTPLAGTADVQLARQTPDWFAGMTSATTPDPSDWINLHELASGWSYIRYDGNFEFLVSPPGDRIFYRLLADVTPESFQTYALGRVFSFALVKMGFEPLHAATVVVNGKAVAFMGASAFGKSSLAACFVAGGHPLLTDDVLRLEECGASHLAFPGPPRLKLLPRVARIYRGDVSAGTPINRNAGTPKLVFPLPTGQYCPEPVPLGAIYVVTEPRRVYRRQKIAISSLPAVEALVKLLTFTHNHELTGPDRLVRQFNAARGLIGKVPVRALSYPRILSSLPDVKAAILADLAEFTGITNHVDPI